MYAKKNSGKKVVATLLAIALLMGVAIGGTIAYLVDSTTEVTNTFAVGKIDISLDETHEDGFTVVPGGSDDKDPVVTVEEGSEKCYVYVSVTNNLVIGTETVATLNIGSNWTAVGSAGNETVYKYTSVVDASTAAQKLPVFTTVSYDGTKITADNINTLKDKTIVVQAYAHQSENLGTDVNVDQLACTFFDVTLNTTNP